MLPHRPELIPLQKRRVRTLSDSIDKLLYCDSSQPCECSVYADDALVKCPQLLRMYSSRASVLSGSDPRIDHNRADT